jgi:hypothetical protein
MTLGRPWSSWERQSLCSVFSTVPYSLGAACPAGNFDLVWALAWSSFWLCCWLNVLCVNQPAPRFLQTSESLPHLSSNPLYSKPPPSLLQCQGLQSMLWKLMAGLEQLLGLHSVSGVLSVHGWTGLPILCNMLQVVGEDTGLRHWVGAPCNDNITEE